MHTILCMCMWNILDRQNVVLHGKYPEKTELSGTVPIITQSKTLKGQKMNWQKGSGGEGRQDRMAMTVTAHKHNHTTWTVQLQGRPAGVSEHMPRADLCLAEFRNMWERFFRAISFYLRELCFLPPVKITSSWHWKFAFKVIQAELLKSSIIWCFYY